MIDSTVLNTLVFNAFTGKTTWLAASKLYPIDEFIEAFYQTRTSMRKQLDGVTDAQAHFFNDKVAVWSLSETITHLIYTQAFYHNSLVDITSTHRPHIIEAARGFGEGAHQNIPVETLRTRLDEATGVITEAITQTRPNYDPVKTARNPAFGEVTYATWILLLLAHEIDHIRQAVAMRRTARATLPETESVSKVVTPPAEPLPVSPPAEPPTVKPVEAESPLAEPPAVKAVEAVSDAEPPPTALPANTQPEQTQTGQPVPGSVSTDGKSDK